MTQPPLAFCFGIHNHQPIGNFDSVVAETTARAYHPMLERVRARPEVRLTVHCTGSLLLWLREHARATFDLLGTVVAAGQVELLTGGFYEPILAILPDADKRGQIERLTAFLHAEFGVRPRGMWLAERVWEPHLPRALREAGVEYVLLDDSHFALAGLAPEALGGYYVTEEQGTTLAVFPISQRLRYLIPFAEVGKTIEYLGSRRDAGVLTVVDDGEKFGAWPGTHEHVYRQGWLDAFFDRVLGTPWLRMTTFSEVRDRLPSAGRVYLPTASYQEMGDWSLPAEAGQALEAARRELGPVEGGARITALLRGGFWRAFLVKYPEVADMYWKMLRLSRAVDDALTAQPGEPGLVAARESLWRGQANDAYWHGVFGGCYLPHLRRAVKSSLLDAERRLAAGAPAITAATARVGDANGDGRDEILVRTAELALAIDPALGGALTELAFLPRTLDLADVMTRRPEAYHDQVRHRRPAASDEGAHTIHDAHASKEAGLDTLLAYDTCRRACLLDGLLYAGALLDAVTPWPAAHAFPTARPRFDVHEEAGSVVIAFAAAGGVAKRIVARGASVRAEYRVEAPEEATFAVQWNLALTGGDAPGRYLSLPGRPSLGSRGRTGRVREVTLTDEWIGVDAHLAWSDGGEIAWGPVETVSVSETGFERIYQGIALLIAWAPGVRAGGEVWTKITVAGR
ncbi:MAG TPA: alpha-amylase/4-alpha-glucanotransferase domain-containing protein [Candidatus Limnocylindria bacterium]|nr:alpha-amylase/4-alpha-glucanotransferase domain-containing protein [Candidatus Limnocylindria bacterium]